MLKKANMQKKVLPEHENLVEAANTPAHSRETSYCQLTWLSESELLYYRGLWKFVTVIYGAGLTLGKRSHLPFLWQLLSL